MLTVAQAKLLEVLLHPAGSAPRADVIEKPVAGLPSSVVKTTVTGVVLPVKTASEAGVAVQRILSFVVARYAMLTEPVLGWPALFK